MKRFNRATFYITAVVLATLLVLSSVCLIRRARRFSEELVKGLLPAVSKQLGRPVSAGSVKISWYGSITLNDVRVLDKQPSAHPLFTANSANIRLSPWVLVRHPGDPLFSIKTINLYKPVLHLSRDEKGRWNIADLLRFKPTAVRPVFRGVLRASQGTIVLEDRFGRPSQKAKVSTFQNASLVFDARKHPFSRLTAETSGVDSGVGALSLRAALNIRRGDAVVGVKASGLNLPRLASAISAAPELVVRSGTGNCSVEFEMRASKLLPDSLRICSDASRVAVQPKGIPELHIDNLNIKGRGGRVSIRSTGWLPGVHAAAGGEILWQKKPSADITILADAHDPDAFLAAVSAFDASRKQLKLGRGKAVFHLHGELRRPRIDAEASFERIAFAKIAFEKPTASLVYDGGLLKVTSAQWHMGRGIVRMSGWARIPPLLRGLDGEIRFPMEAVARAPKTAPGELPTTLDRFSFSGQFVSIPLDIFASAAQKRISEAGNRSQVQSIPSGLAKQFATGRFSVRKLDGRVSASLDASVQSDGASTVGFQGARVAVSGRSIENWSAVFRADAIRFHRISARDLMARVSCSPGGLEIESAEARSWGGRFALRGKVFKGGELALAVRAEDVDIGKLAEGLRQEVSRNKRGSVERKGFLPGCEGVARFSGRIGGTLGAPSVSGRAVVLAPQCGGILLDTASGNVTFDKKRVTLTDFRVRRDGGTASVSGWINFAERPTNLDFTAEVSEVPAATVASALGVEKEMPGILGGRLRMFGTPDEWRITGEAKAEGLKLANGVSLSTGAKLNASAEGIVLSDISLVGPGLRLSGEGKVTPDGLADIALSGSDLDLAALRDATSLPIEIEGSSRAAVAVVGPLESPKISAYVSCGPLSVGDVDFNSATAGFELANGRVTVQNAQFQLPVGSITVKELVYLPQQKWLSVSGSAQGVDLPVFESLVQQIGLAGRIRDFTASGLDKPGVAVPAGGALNADFVAQGEVGSISGRMLASIEGLSLPPASAADLAGEISWSPSGIEFNRFTADGPGLAVSGTAALPQGARPLVVASVSNTDIGQALRCIQAVSPFLPEHAREKVDSALQNLPQPISGAFDGALLLSGSGSDLDGTAVFNSSALKIRGEQLSTVSGDLAIADGKVLVRRLTAAGEQLRASVTGSTGFGGELDLDIEASNVNLAALGPLLGLSSSVSGTADISAKASGTVEKPILRASVSTSSLKVGDVAVRLVSAPGITVQGDRLELGNVAVAGDTFQATVSGTLPFSWSPIGLPKDKPIDLELSLARQDLSALTLVTDEVSGVEGEVKGTVKISGDLERPILEGVVEANAETLSLSRVKNSFRNLKAVLELQDNTATIKELKLSSSEGGMLEGEGEVSLAGLPRSPFDVKLHASGLQLHLVNASGVYGEVFRGSLSGDLRLRRESGQDARLEGEIVASEGGLSLPVQSQPRKTAPSAPRNLPIVLLGTQDGTHPLRFRLGRNFQLIRGGLRATVTDDLYLTGSLSEPEISGTLTFQSGSVRFATQRFRIVPGGIMRVSYSPRRGGRVLLDLSAQTSVYARTGRNGERQRYTITVDLSGPMENPRTTFSSDPPGLSSRQMLAAVGRQAEIEAILRGQDADKILREQLGQAFVGAFIPEITSPIEQAISEALGLEEFAIIYDFGSETHFQLTKQLLGRLYLTYRRTLSGPRSEFLWKLAYRLKRRLQLSYSADERHVGTWSIEGRISF
jgi:hypothetical protein